jgi:hypothetical protein
MFQDSQKDLAMGWKGNKRGNPAWYRGMPSANPKGRPKGNNSIEAFYRDPELFDTRHMRWWRFCLKYATAISKIGNATEAARWAGYSPKSARFIASRLRKKAVIRAKLREWRKIIDATRKISEGVYMIPDYSRKYHIYRNKKI